MVVGSSIFGKYFDHVQDWEGGKSKDPQDSAASCAPYSGAYHTNMGITYCTFRELAASLGILPVTYDRFLNMSAADAKRFLYRFYQLVNGPSVPDFTALAMTEAAWGSGPQRAIKHLQNALNELGENLTVDGVFGPKTLAAVKRANPTDLYRQYWVERWAYLEYLLSKPAWDQYRNGWTNRKNSFLQRFPLNSAGTGGGIFPLLALGFFLIVIKP